MTRPDWGPWRYKPSTLVLTCDRYEVDLERIPSSAAVLDWIAQVSRKQWADAETVAGLVHALDDCLHLQANYCSFGAEKARPVTGDRLRRYIAQRLEWLDESAAAWDEAWAESVATGGHGLVALSDIQTRTPMPRWPR